MVWIKSVLFCVVIALPLLLTQIKFALPMTHWDPVKVENGTLVIGEHAIALRSLSSELCEIAKESAKGADIPAGSPVGQGKTFYKSDLVPKESTTQGSGSEGTWYELDSANNIWDVSPGGPAVSLSIIAQLPVRYYTDILGKTYDFVNHAFVDIFSLVNPYDLNSLPELDSLRDKRSAWQSDASAAAAHADEIVSIGRIFAPISKTVAMQVLDGEKAALAKLHAWLIEQEAGQNEKNQVTKLQEQVEQRIKWLVLQLVDSRVDTEMPIAMMSRVTVVSNGDDDEEEKVYTEYTEYGQALETAKNKIKESADALAETSLASADIITKTTEQKQRDVVSKAVNNSFLDARKVVGQIVNLENISGQRVVDKTGERDVIAQMQKSALADYKVALNSGESADYKKAVKASERSPVLEGLLNAAVPAIEQLSADVFLLAEADLLRLNDEEKIASLDEVLRDVNQAKAMIRDDGFLGIFAANAESLIDDLLRLKTEVQNRMNGGSEQDKLNASLALVTEKLEEALDANDLVTAKELEAKREDLQRQTDQDEAAAIRELIQLREKMMALDVEQRERGESFDERLAAIDASIALLCDENVRLGIEKDVRATTLEEMAEEQSKRLSADISELRAAAERLLISQDAEDHSIAKSLAQSLLQKQGERDELVSAQIGNVTDAVDAKIAENKKLIEAEQAKRAELAAEQPDMQRLAEIEQEKTALKGEMEALKRELHSATLEAVEQVDGAFAALNGEIQQLSPLSNMQPLESGVNDLLGTATSSAPAAGLAAAALEDAGDLIAAKLVSGEPMPTDLARLKAKIASMVASDLSKVVASSQTKAEIRQKVAGFWGGSGIGEKERQVIELCAYAEVEKQTADDVYASLLLATLNDALQGNNPAVFLANWQLNGDIYLPLDGVMSSRGGTYVWKDGKGCAVEKNEVHEFTAGNDVVVFCRADKSDQADEVPREREMMSEKAKLGSVLMIPRDYGVATFQVNARSLSSTKYAAMFPVAHEEKILGLISVLLPA
jgi:hypothetical protein